MSEKDAPTLEAATELAGRLYRVITRRENEGVGLNQLWFKEKDGRVGAVIVLAPNDGNEEILAVVDAIIKQDAALAAGEEAGMEPNEMFEMENWCDTVPKHVRVRWLAAWRRQDAAQKARIETLTTALREAICDCAPRHPSDDVPLDNLPGHHEFGCAFRGRMQPALAAGKEE